VICNHGPFAHRPSHDRAPGVRTQGQQDAWATAVTCPAGTPEAIEHACLATASELVCEPQGVGRAFVSSPHGRLIPVGAAQGSEVGQNISSRPGLAHEHAPIFGTISVSFPAHVSPSRAGPRSDRDVWPRPRALPGSTAVALARSTTVSARAGLVVPAVASGRSLPASVRHHNSLLRTRAVSTRT